MTILTKGQLYKEDFDLYNGNSATGSRKTSTGGTQTLNKIDWVGVDVYAIYAAKTDAAITNAINNAGSSNRAFFFSPGTWTLSNNLTIPANIAMLIPPGVSISIASGKTLTIAGQIIAGEYAIFTGDGAISLTGYAGAIILSDWFGSITPTGTPSVGRVGIGRFPTSGVELEVQGDTYIHEGDIKVYDANGTVIHSFE